MTEQGKTSSEQKLMTGDPETTGHSWDGIREFNNPLPRWWLWTLYATILWAIGYTIAYPAWPMISGATRGVIGFSTRENLAEDVQRFDAMNSDLRERLEMVDLAAVTPWAEPDLYNYAIQGGAAVFRTWCAQCHGAGAAGVQASGYPNLLDDDWLWGGSVEDIHLTIRHGIRNEDDPDARYSQMTAYEGILSDEEIAQVVEYVRAISDHEAEPVLAALGEDVFLDNCAACHGENGTGDRFLGAPNLTDAIWLYGGSREAIDHTVRNARFGVMPSWQSRLSPSDIRAVSIYVHALGGGE